MNDESSPKRRKPTSGDDMPPVQTPTWALATEEDARTVDFEAPIASSKDADAQPLSRLYRTAALAIPEADDSASRRIFVMLEGVMSMHPKIADAHDPFGPMVVMGNSRSAIPSDFRGHVDVLTELARRASNPVLRARISDVCWILDRKRAALSNAAIASYLDIVHEIECGGLVQRFAKGDRLLTHHVRDTTKRALQIGRAIGWDKPEVLKARQLAMDLRNRAVRQGSAIALHQFSSLDIEFELSPPQNVAAEIEGVLATAPSDADVHNIVSLWRLAASAYHYAKMPTDKARCQLQAAERLAAEAARPISAMLAAHFLSEAIAQLSGVPGAKDRRNALRHQLIDVQSRVPDEMTTFSQGMDLREFAENVQKQMEGQSLRDKLFLFATIDRSPDLATLVADARKSIREHPLMSLFGTEHMDREGKVVHRTEALDPKGDDDAPAVRQQISQAESIRRTIDTGGGRSSRHARPSSRTTTFPKTFSLPYYSIVHSYRENCSVPLRAPSPGTFRVIL